MTAEKIRHGEPRFDALRPAVFDPADFAVVDIVDIGTEEGMPRDPDAGRLLREYFPERDPDGDDDVTVCDHCGNVGLVYLGVVRQLSTGDLFVFGSSCVAKAGLENRAELDFVAATGRAVARAERIRAMISEAHYLDENPDLRAFLLSIDRDKNGGPADSFDFVNSLDRALAKYGHLTDRQAVGLRKVIAKRVELAANPEPEVEEPAGPAVEGKQTIEGTVVKVKFVEGYMPGSSDPKMVVRLENRSTVWSTVPVRIVDAFMVALRDGDRADFSDGLAGWLEGKRVRFAATFEVSDKDPSFAFARRPSQAEIVEEVDQAHGHHVR